MHRVGGDDHAAGGDLVAHLLGRQMPFALGDAFHLRGDDAQAGVFELSDSNRAASCGGCPRRLAAALTRREEIPSGLA